MRFRRLLRAALLLLIILVLALGGGAVYVVRRPFPQTNGTLHLAGLQAPVEVIRDRWGIPHIFAQNSHDLFFVQGYVHAQDRLWQMELFRRAASGRLSEILGPATLEFDRLMRVVGLRRAAEAAWAAATPQALAADPDFAATVEIGRAYSDGVNTFMETHRQRLPLEFTLLRFQPDPWSPVDSLAFAKLMAWILGGNWTGELLRGGLAVRFGPDGAAVLLTEQAPHTPTIIAGGAPAVALPAGFPFSALLAGLTGVGSNNWAVAPSRSASGGALFANDIHLDIQVPSIWYEIHLVGGPYDVIGGSFAGAPGVVAGHNRHIAWGLTTAYVDEQDLYVERFHPRDPSLYLHRGQWERARVLREEITVKGRRDPQVVTVRITRHGPLLNPAVRGLGAFYALRWVADDPDRIFQAVLDINRAANWEEFRRALRTWWAPAHNVVYADRDGNIGYVLAGRIPLRPAGYGGGVPAPGWTGDAEWLGFVPTEQHPAAFNPPRGFIVTANNRVAADYPYHLGDEYDSGFRAGRITELLEARPRLTADDLVTVQLDVTSLLARRLVGAWQTVHIADPGLAPLFDEVKRWDGRVTADSRAAATYESLLVEVLRIVFRDALDADLFRRYMRRDAALLVLLEMSGRPLDPWWGDGRDRAIEEALRRAARDLEKRLGPDRSRWRWGRLHIPAFDHPLGEVTVLRWIFNPPPPSIGGDPFTVNVAGFDPESPFRTVLAPSYRRVIDMKTLEARAIHAPGQSGLPFHRHYRDFLGMWARGEYHPLLLDRAAIEAAGEGTLMLLPR